MNACDKRIVRLTREALGAPDRPTTPVQSTINSLGALAIAFVAALSVWAPLEITTTHIAKADSAVVAR